MDNSISVILPVFNQEPIIERVIMGILDFSSVNVKEVIVIFDGCTDRTKDVVRRVYSEHPRLLPFYFLDNPVGLWEVKSCNRGLKMSNCIYSLMIQDDMEMTEFLYDERLLKPFLTVPNLFAVTGRDSVDVRFNSSGGIEWYNFGPKDRNIFSIRDVINRGPFLVDNSKLKELNYLDETFAPIAQDDTDLCFRAYRHGWVVGGYPINYNSPIEWGTTRKNPESKRIQSQSEWANLEVIKSRHFDLITGPKHSQDIRIEE